MTSRKKPERSPRTSRKATKAGAKKVAALLRQLPGASSENLLSFNVRVGGELEVSTLVRDLGSMIDAARKQVAVAANAALTTLYWQIGHRVRTEVLDERRAEYGGQIVSAVGKQLEAQYGRGFGEKNLRRMLQFAALFPDPRDCRDAVATIGMVALHRPHPDQGAAEARVLR